MNRVLVYGTLKKGNLIRGLDKFKGARFIAEAHTLDNNWGLIDIGPFPAAVPGNCNIRGEVWEVTNKLMRELDMIEGYPDHYNRKLVQTTQGVAWLYYYNNACNGIPNSKVVFNKTGNWLMWDDEFYDAVV